MNEDETTQCAWLFATERRGSPRMHYLSPRGVVTVLVAQRLRDAPRRIPRHHSPSMLLMRPTFPFVAALALFGACAPASHFGADLGPIDGATTALQPRIASATSGIGTRLQISYVIPERSYVSFLRVHTQASIALLAASGQGTATAMQPIDAGAHKLALEAIPVYLGANANRAGVVRNAADGALVVTDSPYPVHDYVLVIATATPLEVDDIQSSLEHVDLRGPDNEVLARIGQAIGAHSLGAWGASAARPARQSAPF